MTPAHRRRYVVVAPLAPLAVGDRFTTGDWPLHVTLVPTFFTAAEPAALGETLTLTGAVLAPLAVVVGEDALYGARHTVPVSEVVMDAPLRAGHAALVEALGEHGIEFETPGYAEAGFAPHVTHRRGWRLSPDDVVHLTQVALVDMEPGQPHGRRAVLAVSVLTAGASQDLH